MPKYLLRVRNIRTNEIIVEKEAEAQDDPSATQEGLTFLRKTRREVSGAAWSVDVLRMIVTLNED